MTSGVVPGLGVPMRDEALAMPAAAPPAAAAARPVPWWRSRTAYALFWGATALGMLETGKGLVMTRLHGEPMGLAEELIENMPWWYLWALFAPAVIWLARRFPVRETADVARRLWIHALGAVVIGTVHIWIIAPLYYYTAAIPPTIRAHSSWTNLAFNFQAQYLMTDVVTYVLIVAVVHAVDYFGRYANTRVQAAQLETQAAELQRDMVEARLDALRKEINPHFLFNTLNAISGQVRRGENDDAVVMLARLGDLLRLTLDRNLPPEVTLDDELELLRRYLDIEQTRFHDRLTVTIDVPDSVRGARVPTLFLQPLVENAVRHGIGAQPGAGFIEISAREEHGSLRVVVRDSGPGFPATSTSDGLGLSNTRSRLRQLYGDASGVEIGNPERGAEVRVWLPLQRDG